MRKEGKGFAVHVCVHTCMCVGGSLLTACVTAGSSWQGKGTIKDQRARQR